MIMCSSDVTCLTIKRITNKGKTQTQCCTDARSRSAVLTPAVAVFLVSIMAVVELIMDMRHAVQCMSRTPTRATYTSECTDDNMYVCRAAWASGSVV